MQSPLLNQKGYIGMVVIIFLILLAAIVYPWKFTTFQATECRVGEAVDPEVLISMPAIKNAGLGRGLEGGWDESRPDVEYVLIRKNVPIFMNSTDPNVQLGNPDWNGKDDQVVPPMRLRWPVIADHDFLGRHADDRHTIKYPEANQPGFDVYYPNLTGEVELPQDITDRNGETTKILTLRTEGFLLFVHLDQDNTPVKLNYGQHIYYLVDFYQDKALYETPDEVKGYNADDMFHCLDPDAPGPTAITDPIQDKSPTKDQLQMEWFLMGGVPGMNAHCKPAVYLYPEKKQLVNVKVFPKGELSYTDPPYDAYKGWTVLAEPDGKLQSINDLRLTIYDYLYYESKILDSEIKKPGKGWVVQFNELDELYEKALPKLGLNQKEKADFINYWSGKLPAAPYYFVGLMDKDQRDYLEPLSVTPNPNTSIRFSLYFEPLDQPISVSEPEITTPERTGFTLVDWGGMIKLHPGTAFTCSQ